MRGLALCLFAAIPIVIMEVRSADKEAAQGIADGHAKAELMLGTADERYNDILVQAKTALDFAAAAAAHGLSGDACIDYFAGIRQRYSWITGMGLLDPGGRVLCGTPAALLKLPFGNEPHFQKAIATKQLAVSDFRVGRSSHKPVIGMMSPVLDATGSVAQVVGMGIDLKEFSSLIERERIEQDVSITIFDSGGTVIARYPNSERFLGQNMASHPLFQQILAQHTGTYDGAGIDNIQRIISFKPFAEGASYIAVGLLEGPILDRVHQRLEQSLLVVLGIGFGATLIGLMAAEVLVFSPARNLTRAARLVGEGQFDSVPALRSAMPEIGEMLDAFAQMAGRLKKREAELRDSEAEAQTSNRNLLLGEQIANAGYWRVDIANERLSWSEGVYRIFGYDPRSFTPTVSNAIDCYHPDDRKAVSDAVELAIAFHRDYEQVLRVVRPDGEIRHVLSRGFCELEPSGDIKSLFGVVLDVTVQKENEARLLAARQAAEAASRAKSDFLSSMSHELRTPLTSIIGFCDLLLMRTRSVETRRYLKLQREAGHHLLTLISDILDHSKIEAGQLQLETIPFNLRSMVRSCLSVMEHEARRRNLTLNSTVGIAVPDTVTGDPARLKQILLNLIGNALKFTPQGEVTVDVELIGTAGDVMALKFAVSDTGPGIPADRLDKLFRRFAQGDASITRQFGGTGLGLSISKDLVEAMGGTIGVESTFGNGATFWFALRLLSTSEGNQLPSESVDLPLRQVRILLAEDSPVNQLLFTELLQALGHQVVTVAEGASALQAVRDDGEFDLILMDVQMPIMDGLTATRAIRSLPGEQLPIIGLTANAMQEDVDRCLAAGMDAHLAKPVDLPQLIEAIRRVMTVRQGLA